MSQRALPAHPNLDHLKNQARTLLRQCLAPDPSALSRFTAIGVTSSQPKLADALHVIASEYGFATWPALKLHLDITSQDSLAALTAAIKANDASLVRDVLARHPALQSSLDNPLPHLSFDTPALIAAVQKDNRDMVDAFLAAGAHINERTRWWAGSFGVLDCATPTLAEYLISRGATVDIHAAARLGKLDTVRQLLAFNPQLVHARGGDGQFPLHFAATVDMAALLLDHGAAIDARDIDHESTAAQYMACSGRHDVARFLLTRGAQTDILMASAVGDLALAERILNDDPETIRTSVSDRYFPKHDPKSGGTIYYFGFGVAQSPHMLAHQFGHAAVFELLMQRSAPWLRLVQAAEIGDESRVRQIIQQHPGLFTRLNGNAARRIVGTALRNNSRAVELLLEQGWPANPTLDNNQTALHYAAWHGNAVMVQSLLARNAPVNVFETEHGGSPLAWALHGSLNSWHREKGDYPTVVRTLLAAGADIPKPDRPLQATEEVLALLEQPAT